MVEPPSLNFRVFTVKLGVQKFRNFTVCYKLQYFTAVKW